MFGKTSDRATLQMVLASTNTASIVNTNYLVEHSLHPQVATQTLAASVIHLGQKHTATCKQTSVYISVVNNDIKDKSRV